MSHPSEVVSMKAYATEKPSVIRKIPRLFTRSDNAIAWPVSGRSAIVVANHTSLLDGPALAWLTPQPMLFGVDPAYSLHPLWRKALIGYASLIGTGCDMVPMEPGSLLGLRALLRRLEEGGWVCLFPEGGIRTGCLHAGAAWLSQRTNAPIHRLEIRSFGLGKLRMPYGILPAGSEE